MSFVECISDDIRALKDENRNIRKQALLNIKKKLQNAKKGSTNVSEISSDVYTPLVERLSDSVEKCREIASEILLELLADAPSITEELLPYTLAVLVQRLGHQEIREPSEEVRLLQVQILGSVISQSHLKCLSPYFDKCVQILSQTILDPSPDVIKESCICSSHLASTLYDVFHMQADSLVKRLLQAMNHHHSKIRIGCIKALGDVARHGSDDSISNVLARLSEQQLDHSPSVRLAVVSVVGSWLCQLPNRYSHFQELLLLILTSLSDEVDVVRETAKQSWETAGIQFLSENNKLNISEDLPENYPNDITRPTPGCRAIVQGYLSKAMPLVESRLEDWKPAVRINASILLYNVILHAEQSIFPLTEKIIKYIIYCAADNEQQVVKQAEKCAGLLSIFADPTALFSTLLCEISESGATSASLFVLASVLKGCTPKVVSSYLPAVCKTLASPSVCQTCQVSQQKHILSIVDVILSTCSSEDVNLPLFKTLLSTLSFSDPGTDLAEKSEACLARLTGGQCTEKRIEFYKTHGTKVLQELKVDVNSWDKTRPEVKIFCTLLSKSGPALGDMLDDVVPFLVTVSSYKMHPMIRNSVLSVLSSLLKDCSQTLDASGNIKPYISQILTDSLIPNLAWHPGKDNEKIRSVALSCLNELVLQNRIEDAEFKTIGEKLLDVLKTLLEDEVVSTRLTTGRLCGLLLPKLVVAADKEQILQFYLTFFGRVNDINDEVWMTAVEVLKTYFMSLSNILEQDQIHPHIAVAIRYSVVQLSSCTHPKIQEAILDILKQIAESYPVLFAEEVQNVKVKTLNQEVVNQVLQLIENMDVKND